MKMPWHFEQQAGTLDNFFSIVILLVLVCGTCWSRASWGGGQGGTAHLSFPHPLPSLHLQIPFPLEKDNIFLLPMSGFSFALYLHFGHLM